MKTKLKNKSISALLASVLAMTALAAGVSTANAAETSETNIMLGDVNADGIINIDDATDIQKYIAELVGFDYNKIKAANIYDENDKIDINDVTELQKYLTGLSANENIGKTWYEAESTQSWVLDSEPQLRYVLLQPNVCNYCDVPFINEDGTYWTDDQQSAHKLMHSLNGESAGNYRKQSDWYYVDENGKYHDLDDDGKVAHKISGTDYEEEENVFDVGFKPSMTAYAIYGYNSTHTNKFYFSIEQWAYCTCCNSDGSSIFDEWGGIGNITDGYLYLSDKIETVVYPDEVSNIDAYNEAYDYVCQAVETHKAEHIEKGDIPSYLDGPEAYIANTNKIYCVDSFSGHYEETVIREAGWY